jgi:HSP20 family molecular chaperone IbpA
MTAVLDLPGLAKSDVSIALQPGKLVVSAQRRSASSSTAKGKGREDDASEAVEWQVRERLADSVKWERELPLAPGIKVRPAVSSLSGLIDWSPDSPFLFASQQPSEIKASMADGVLTITYPKAAAGPDEQQVLIE